jgi:hypothetical protein
MADGTEMIAEVVVEHVHAGDDTAETKPENADLEMRMEPMNMANGIDPGGRKLSKLDAASIRSDDPEAVAMLKDQLVETQQQLQKQQAMLEQLMNDDRFSISKRQQVDGDEVNN